MQALRSLGFVAGAGPQVGPRSRRVETSPRRRPVVCVQPAPIGSQVVDFVFLGAFLGLMVGAGFLLANGFTADITTKPNQTEGINLPRVQAYTSSVRETSEPNDEPAPESEEKKPKKDEE